tara:strand:+ start:64 stop:381 length:318 start_codon:yes stop_codon:yes gene_type:complete
MKAREIPVDCFSIRYAATGSAEELASVWVSYREEYPTIQYGTRIEHIDTKRTKMLVLAGHLRPENTGTLIIRRFKTIQDCKNACLQEVSGAPLEKGQDHTIFQTT